jgi:hypothetical protein
LKCYMVYGMIYDISAASVFKWLACWPLVPNITGSLPAEAVGFFGRKILSMPSFGREVKPFAPCHRFAACKRSLNGVKKASFRQNYGTILAHSSTFRY